VKTLAFAGRSRKDLRSGQAPNCESRANGNAVHYVAAVQEDQDSAEERLERLDRLNGVSLRLLRAVCR
jgi:hypothetical protein